MARPWPSGSCSRPCWPGDSIASTTSAVALHRRVVGGFDLYADLPVGASARELVEFMARDKKARHDLTFVLDGPNGVEPVHQVDEADVLATLADMGCAP